MKSTEVSSASYSEVDSVRSNISFKIKKLGLLTVTGNLPDMTGRISFDEDNLANSFFDVHLSAVNIDTGNSKRDEHLRSEDFFFVRNYPSIRFESSSISKFESGFKAVGELILIGNAKTLEIPFTFQNGIFEGQLVLNRFDFSLGKKFPGFIVGKNVTVNIICKTK